MTTKPISDRELDHLLDLAAGAPAYDHEKLCSRITAQTLPAVQSAETEGWLLITVIKHPLRSAAAALSVTILGLFTGLGAAGLYDELLTTALFFDTPLDLHNALLLI